MRRNTIAHDRDQLGVNLVLVLLIVTLELVELDQHDSLLRGEVAPKRFANIWYEGDHDREGLRSERQMLGSDVFQAGGTHRASTQYDLTRPGIEGFEELDDTRHRVCREEAKVHDHFEVVDKEKQCILGSRYRKMAPVLYAEVFSGRRGR